LRLLRMWCLLRQRNVCAQLHSVLPWPCRHNRLHSAAVGNRRSRRSRLVPGCDDRELCGECQARLRIPGVRGSTSYPWAGSVSCFENADCLGLCSLASGLSVDDVSRRPKRRHDCRRATATVVDSAVLWGVAICVRVGSAQFRPYQAVCLTERAFSCVLA
jgi:hypothetical protein